MLEESFARWLVEKVLIGPAERFGGAESKEVVTFHSHSHLPWLHGAGAQPPGFPWSIHQPLLKARAPPLNRSSLVATLLSSSLSSFTLIQNAASTPPVVACKHVLGRSYS